MILKGKQRTWDIEDSYFAKGGEGELHNVIGTNDYVVKIYKEGVLSADKLEKLEYMVSLYQPGRFDETAWPVDVVRDQAGKALGFVMRRFNKTVDMAELLDGKANETLNMNWAKRIVIAHNLAVLVDHIHSAGQLIGDMNPKNFGVDLESATVNAFDADSFHLYDPEGRKWYPCVVMNSHYVAPELQERLSMGMRIDQYRPEQTFSLQTDLFALAVLIFQLLFNGTHPFTGARVQGRGSSVVVNNREKNICQHTSPYFNPAPNIVLPKYAPPLSIVPPEMQDAFRRAFLADNRPSAREWHSMIKALSRQLTQCEDGHYYWKNNDRCPWCEKNRSVAKWNVTPTPQPESVQSTSAPRPASTSAPGQASTPQPEEIVVLV